MGEKGVRHLYHLSPDGAALKKVPLSHPIPSERPGAFQMVCVGKYVVILSRPVPAEDGKGLLWEPHAFVVEPQGGKIVFVSPLELREADK